MRQSLSLLLILALSFPQSAHALRALEVTESGAEETVARSLRNSPSAGLEEKPGGDWKTITGDASFMNERGVPRWGFSDKDWAGLWYLFHGNVPESLDDTLDELNRMSRGYRDGQNSSAARDGELAQRLARALYGRIRAQSSRVAQEWAWGIAVGALISSGVLALGLIVQQAMMIPPQVGRPMAIDPFADEPVVVRTESRRTVPPEAFRFKWQGEGPIAERDGERVDFNDWDKLGEALNPEQIDLFLREKEGSESWLVPVDAALPVDRKVRVFDQVGIPAQQRPRNLNYFDLSREAASEITPDLLEGGIQDGDVVILRADQVTPEGVKGLIPEGVKARVVLLTPLMLKQMTARQLLFVAGQLDPGETLWIERLSYVTLEGQRYLLIAA